MFATRFKMVASPWQLKYISCISNRLGLHHCISKNFSLSSESDNDDRSMQNPDAIEKEDVSSEESHIQADLSVITNNDNPNTPSLKTVSVVPGKGPPPEPPVTCCMSGCANCVWIAYAEELKAYYGEGGEMKAIDNIEDPSLKAFIKLELGLK